MCSPPSRTERLRAQRRLLHAAVRHLVGTVGRHVTDNHAADLEFAMCLERGRQVVGENASLQAAIARRIDRGKRLVDPGRRGTC